MVKPLLVAEIAVNNYWLKIQRLIKNQVIEYSEKKLCTKNQFMHYLINLVFKRIERIKGFCEDIGLSQVYDKIFIDNKAIEEKEDLKKWNIY